MSILKHRRKTTNRQEVLKFMSREFMQIGFHLFEEPVLKGNILLVDDRIFHRKSSRHTDFLYIWEWDQQFDCIGSIILQSRVK